MTRNAKLIVAISTTVMVASLVWTIQTRNLNLSLRNDLEKERLRSEALLSEKLLLEKDLNRVAHLLVEAKTENSRLDEAVRASSEKLAALQKKYGKSK